MPTLREIKQLPRKQAQSSAAESLPTWSLQQGVLFAIGLFVLTASLLSVAWLGYGRLQLDTREFVIEQAHIEAWDDRIMAMDAAASLDAWNVYLNKPLLERRALPEFETNRAAARLIYWKMGVAGVFGVVGVGLMLAGILFKPRPVAKRKVRRPSQAVE